MADWFYASGTEPTGPITEEELQKMFATGTLTAETSVWQAGMDDWALASEVAAFAQPAPPLYIITPVIPKKPPARTPVVPPPPAPSLAAAPLAPGRASANAPAAQAPPFPAAPSSPARVFPPLPEIKAAPTATPHSPAAFPRPPLLIPRWVKIAGLLVAAGVLYSCLALPWHLAAAFNYARGQKAEDRKDYAAAAVYYQSSLKECPLSPVVLGRLGVVSIYQGDQNTLDWVNGELAQSGGDDDSDAAKARASINEALKSGKR